MKARGTKWLALGAILLVTAAVYANSLGNPFIPDDRRIIFVNFPEWRPWSFGDMFERSLFGTSPSEIAYFRPLTLFTFALNRQIAGENPAGYRAVNLGLHLLVVAALFLVLRRLVGSRLATWATLLYAVHPVHVQAVSYISSRSDLLYALLALLCLNCWLTGGESSGKGKAIYLGGGLGLFFLGLFAKETMVVVPPLLLLLDLNLDRALPWRQKLAARFPWYFGLALLFGIYLATRLAFGHRLLMEEGLRIALANRVFMGLELFARYLSLAVYPVQLAFFRTLRIPQSPLEWPVLAGAILLGIMLFLAWRLRDQPGVSFGILWYIIALLPVLNLTLLNAPMMEHWLYLPLAGLTLAVVGMIHPLAERLGESRAAAVGLLLAALLLSAKTVARNNEWSEPLRLFTREATLYPDNARVWTWIASALKNQGRLQEAVDAYKKSLALSPGSAEARLGLGEALSFLGKEKEADEALERAISARPQDATLHYILAMHLLATGRAKAAAQRLEKSLSLGANPMAHHALGSAHLRVGDTDKAETEFQRALTLAPADAKFHAEPHVHLGEIYRRQGRLAEAREEWRLALRFDPVHAEALMLLQRYPQ